MPKQKKLKKNKQKDRVMVNDSCNTADNAAIEPRCATNADYSANAGELAELMQCYVGETDALLDRLTDESIKLDEQLDAALAENEELMKEQDEIHRIARVTSFLFFFFIL